MFSDLCLKNIVINAGWRSLRVHDSLGEAGKEKVRNNAHGETALTADLECGNAILDTLRENKLPIRVYSEEDGVVDIGKGTPKFTGVLDGLDGTGSYTGTWKKFGIDNGRYGTLFGIFEGENPTYGDYIVSVFMEHPTKTLFYAVRGQGAWKIENAGRPVPLVTSGRLTLDETTTVIADTLFDRLLGGDLMQTRFRDKLKGNATLRDCGAAQTGYLEVATGSADAILELTRKGNLEPAVAYALIKEAGGEILVKDNEGVRDLGPINYFAFGQNERDRHEFITAATPELVLALAHKLNS